MPRKEPSHIAGFDFAIEKGDLPSAWFHAHGMARVSPYRALRLTILMGFEAGPKYEATARRFLRLFIFECKPSLSLIELTAHALKELGDERKGMGNRNDARISLLKLAQHLERNEPERWNGNLGEPY